MARPEHPARTTSWNCDVDDVDKLLFPEVAAGVSLSFSALAMIMGAAVDRSGNDLSRQASEVVRGLSADAIRWVADELDRRRVDASQEFGGHDWTPADNHLDDHLEVLGCALVTGRPVFFTDHVAWLASVLESRGGQTHLLSQSLDLLDQFLSHSLNPAHAVVVSDLLMRGRRVLADPRAGERVPYGAHRPPDLPQVAALTRMLTVGDVRGIRAMLQEAWEASGDYVDIATRLVQPALYDVGTLWQRNEITVAQEHLAIAISETLLTRLFMTAALFAETSDRSALFACVAGNLHALGLRIVSDAFELAGWTVQYLGANTPTDALVTQVDRARPNVVGLSASMAQQLPTLRRAVQIMKAEFGAQCPTILVGGLPTNQADGIWRWVGSDAWSPDAATAVRELG